MDEGPQQNGFKAGLKGFKGIKGITRDIRQYVEKRTELLVLTVSEQVSGIIAGSIQRVAGLLLLYTGFLFLWAALGYFLAELTGSTALGFLLCSLPLLLGGFLFLKLKPQFVARKIKTGLVRDILESLDSAALEEQEPVTGPAGRGAKDGMSKDGMEEKSTEQKA